MLGFIGTGNYSNFKAGSNVAFTRYSTGKSDELNGLFMIDAGEGVTERLADLNAFSNVDEVTILLTHMHSDHVAGLPGLVTYIKFFVKGDVPVKIYYPHPEDVKKLLSLMLVDIDDFNTTVEDTSAYLGNPNICNLEVYEAMHGTFKNCYSYVFKLQFGAKSERVYYSGDSLLVPRVIDMLEKGEVDKVYHDVDINFKVPNDYPHSPLAKFLQEIPIEYRSKVNAMHLSRGENVESIIKAFGFKVCHSIKDANEMSVFTEKLTQTCSTEGKHYSVKDFAGNQRKEVSQDIPMINDIRGDKLFMHYYADPLGIAEGKTLSLGTSDLSYWSRNPADTDTVYSEPNISEDRYSDRVLIMIEYTFGFEDKIPYYLDYENDRVLLNHTKFQIVKKVVFSDTKIPFTVLQVSPKYNI